jgi:hypothetical protein
MIQRDKDFKLKYDTQFEVSKEEYDRLMTECAGIVAGREEDGKFYCKILLMPYIKEVRKCLKIKLTK